jgi:Na+/proline symporter
MASFLRPNINKEPNCLTLPDIFARRYGKVVEVLISLCTITSFIMILAGNLVGLGAITSYVWGISETTGIWLAAAIVWMYTVSGGLFSVAYTDVAQRFMGWTGCLVASFWLIGNKPEAAPPSIGFPDYVYPNQEICDMYDGVPCVNSNNDDILACCYNSLFPHIS